MRKQLIKQTLYFNIVSLITFQGRIQEFLKGGVVHYRRNLEHQWCARRVTAPASGAIS